MSSVLNREGEEAAEGVRAWLSEQSSGATRPMSVELRRDYDWEDRPAWYFHVVLPDPDPADGSWPVKDLIALDLATRDEALARGVPWPWYVRFHPATDEPQEEDDELEPSG